MVRIAINLMGENRETEEKKREITLAGSVIV